MRPQASLPAYGDGAGRSDGLVAPFWRAFRGEAIKRNLRKFVPAADMPSDNRIATGLAWEAVAGGLS